ncbi:MAG: hypothetical protein A3J74_02505 [Elusimicrobia bacterium RIFCSPHIGHO2_02_FULL_57_9]|nr:MAG: hypothetical protein A3J74_02505 [Elusimicrobia bacterium RIFCSPHIGHO2_02_FULL_57_9]
MIAALMLDPDDAPDFPGNKGMALGRPISAYPLMAAKTSGHIGRQYVVTDSPAVKAVALQYGAVIIDPPKPAQPHNAYAENLLRHGYEFITRELKEEKGNLELLLVFYSHTPTITGELLDQGLEALHGKPELDSAISVSSYNRFNPFDARRITGEGLLEPYGAQDLGHAQAPAEVWFFDWSAQVLRPKWLEAKANGRASFWGRKIFPIKQWGGGPVDFIWQLPAVEFWLKKHGAIDLTPTMKMQPKPQPQAAPKDRR